jgi:hypothetical protein
MKTDELWICLAVIAIGGIILAVAIASLVLSYG